MPYQTFLQRYGMILRDSSKPLSAVDGRDSDLLYEPLEKLYQRQLDMLPNTPRRSNTPKKRLRRRAGW